MISSFSSDVARPVSPHSPASGVLRLRALSARPYGRVGDEVDVVGEPVADGVDDAAGLGDGLVAGKGQGDLGADGVAEPARADVLDVEHSRDGGRFLTDAVDDFGLDAVEDT